MGSEADRFVFTPSFNRSIRVKGHDDRISSHAGTLLLREVNHRLGITRDLVREMHDPRQPQQRRYELEELIDTRTCGIACGLAAQDDQDQLAHDPAMRAAGWHRPGSRVVRERTGSQPTHSRALGIVTRARERLGAMLAEVPRRHQRLRGERHLSHRGTLDIDTFPVTVHGHQVGAVYNGYYGRKVYQPLMASFAPWGDYDHPILGNGFVHARLAGTAPTALEALDFIRAAIRHSHGLVQSPDVRFDAGLATSVVMDGLADDHIHFVGRLRNNSRLDAMAQPHLIRPSGRLPDEGYQRIIEMGAYQAPDWRHSFRLVLVVIDQPDPVTGVRQLFPHHFYLITNWDQTDMPSEALLEHYRRRGTFEDRFSEVNRALNLHLSCHDFARNETTLLLHLLAYNIGNVVRTELERATDSGWDLHRVQNTLFNTAARVVHGGRRICFYLASAAATAWRVLLEALNRWSHDIPPQPRPRPFVPPPAHAHLSLVYRL
ncbi:MAG: IS1380 family transposase [Planctomycetota bacterium]